MSSNGNSSGLLEDFSSKVELNQKLSTDQDQAMADMTTFQQGGAIPTHRQTISQSRDAIKAPNGLGKGGHFGEDALVEAMPRTMSLPNRIPETTAFQVEHLASFQHESADSEITPEVAVKRLAAIGQDGGLFSQLMVMKLSNDYIKMLNGETMEPIEEYSIKSISLAKCITNTLVEDLFVFSTRYSSDKVGAIHLFHCRRTEAAIISTDINNRMRTTNMSTAMINGGFSNGEPVQLNGHSAKVEVQPDEHEPKKDLDNIGYVHDESSSHAHGVGVHQRVEAFQKISTPPKSTEIVRTGSKSAFDYGSKEVRQARVNRDVQILNHCIDEIEAFVVELRKANDARKRLDKKGMKKSMKKKYESVRNLAKGPDEKTIVDVFQKFKFSFILLGKLKPHISNPNAPDLLNYLFVPLQIIVKALGLEKARRVESPLLTSPAIDLLTGCLKTREQDFWRSLGENWYLSATAPQFRSKSIQPYIPIFKNGWTPPEIVVDDRSAAAAKSAAVMVERMKIVEEEVVHKKTALEEIQTQEVKSHAVHKGPQTQVSVEEKHVEKVTKKTDDKPIGLARLNMKTEKRYALVVYDYWAHNNKELTIRAGEKVLILNDTRRWWLVRNGHDEEGYVPSTVLEIPSENSSETSGEGSMSPAASPLSTQNITLATQIQENKIERTVVVDSAVSPPTVSPPTVSPKPKVVPQPVVIQESTVTSESTVSALPTVVAPKSIITDSSQFSNPSSPADERPSVLVVEHETIEKVMRIDDPPSSDPPPYPSPQAAVVVTSPPLQSSLQSSMPPASQPPAEAPMQPPPPPSSQPPSAVIVSESVAVVRGVSQERTLHEELNDRLQKQEPLNSSATLSSVDKVDFFIPLFKSSTADDVTRWLTRLKFEPITIERMSGVAAKELFKFQENELVEKLGEDEGKRLFNELQVQSGAMTRHKTMTEFQKALLERMKRQETIKQSITKQQVTVKTNTTTNPPSQEEMQRKFKEQQDIIANPSTVNDSREPEKHTFGSFQGGSALTNINNNNQSS